MQSWSLPSEVRGYGLVAELACGGMATVYAARKVAAAGFERLVVVKRLHPHLSVDEEALALFKDEARFGAMLHHPNVVPVIDVIEVGNEILLVQPYVESVTLAQLLKNASRSGSLPSPALAIRIVSDVLSGLHEAHEAKDLTGESLNLVHRDLSPQNILVAVDGSSRLIDFGVSMPAGAVDPRGVVLRGKFPYLSPEQINGLSLDRRADLFAAGSLLYEVLTGRRLFSGLDPADTMMKVLAADVPAPSSVVDSIPSALDAVVARALQRDRTDRFQTAIEMMDALEAAVTPATHREVTLWLRKLSGGVLEERRELLQNSFALQTGNGNTSDNAPERLTARTNQSKSLDISFLYKRFNFSRSTALTALLLVIALVLAFIGYARMRSGAESLSTRSAPAEPAKIESAPDQKPEPSESPAAVVLETPNKVREGLPVEKQVVPTEKDLTKRLSRVSEKNSVFRRPERQREPTRSLLHEKKPTRSIEPAISSDERSEAKERRQDGPALHDNPYAP
jgi:serine/threonine protein kinase